MNCHETHALLHAYADGELELLPSLEVERHLKDCSACAAINRSIHSLHLGLRQSDLAYRAPQSLRAQLRRASGKRTPPHASAWLWQWIALGAAGFAVVTLLLRPLANSSSERLAEEAVSSHVRSLMPGHLTDVASSDQHTVKPWFNGKIDFAPQVKDFAAEGFPLIGGRLDYLDGQTVAALVYRHNQHTINLFIWPAQDRRRKAVTQHRGYSIINRDLNGLRYCFVSDLNRPELEKFADLQDL